MGNRIRIGVSSCLLGEKVRYDGGDKLDRYVVDVLGSLFDLVPVCPEVECGLPVPREPMRLEGESQSPRLVALETRTDLTERMRGYCDRKVMELEESSICGFVYKSKSPSCGLRVAVYGSVQDSTAKGLFAAAVIGRFPTVPVVEEAAIDDPELREKFIREVISFRDRETLQRGKK